MSTRTTSQLQQAARVIADACDWAESLDGRGFNKPDASLGHGLAQMTGQWDEGLDRMAWLMLRKYKGQLARAGIDFDQIPEPPDTIGLHGEGDVRTLGREYLRAEALKRGTTVDFDDGLFVIAFPKYPGDRIMGMVKGIRGRRFDPQRRVNTFPASSALEVRKIAEDEDWVVTPDAQTAFGAVADILDETVIEAAREGEIHAHDSLFEVHFDPGAPRFRERLDRVRAFEGRRFDGVNKLWTVPADHARPLIAWAEAEGFFIAEDARKLAATMETVTTAEGGTVEDIDLETEDDLGEIPGLTGTLRPFQRRAVIFTLRALEKGGVLIADEMGLGKTIEAIATMAKLDEWPVLIITPASLKRNWAREIDRWVPDLNVRIVRDGKDDWSTEQHDVVIINYELLAKHEGKIGDLRPTLVICDESHYIKESKSGRSKAVRKIARGWEVEGEDGEVTDVTPRTLLLTGTPVVNKPKDFIVPLEVMDRLTMFGGYRQYTRRYCGGGMVNGHWTAEGASNGVELNRRLRRGFYVRRTKKEVLPELPGKQYTTIEIPMTMGEYRKGLDQFQHQARDNAWGGNSVQGLAEMNRLRQIVARAKLPGMVKWIEDFLESGEKLVVFAHHREIQAGLYEPFKDMAVQILGGKTDDNDEAVTKFQTCAECGFRQDKEHDENDHPFVGLPDAQIMVASLLAGGVGHTLTAASNGAFAELHWTPKDISQPEDRLDRIGQRNLVNIWNLMAPGTIDSVMEEILAAKRVIVDEATDGVERERAYTGSIQAAVFKQLMKEKV